MFYESRNSLIMDARQLQKQYVSIGNILLIALLLLPLVFGADTANAQANLLNNPGFEQEHGDGMNLTPPPGWSTWSNAGGGLVGRQLRAGTEVISSAGIYQGNGSFDAYKGWAAYSVSLYQTVSGIQAGSTLRLAAFGRIWSCDSDVDEATDSCITGDGSVVAQSYTNASFRVGIDPTGGGDPNSGNIVWSSATAPYSGFQQMTVDAQASGGSVTVVLNASMQLPARHQHVFWDAASLTVVSGGTDTSSGSTGQTAAPAAPPAIAAEVVPQGAREDGSIVHTVRSGDTLAAIAVAYNITIPELLELNSMTMDEARYIYPGQELIVEQSSGGSSSSADDSGDASDAGDEGGAEAGEDEAASGGASEGGTPPIESYDAAPVSSEAVPVMQMADAAASGQVCVTLFDDANPNRLRESGEGLLAGGQIALSQAGAAIGSHTTDGASEPHCFEGLNAGEYLVLLTAPQGYGATTASTYNVVVGAGQTAEVVFGAAAGFVPPQPPAVQSGGLFSDEAGTETDTRTDPLSLLFDYSGVLVLGLAGVVLLGGVGITLLLRR
jgi:LysM repeat protein